MATRVSALSTLLRTTTSLRPASTQISWAFPPQPRRSQSPPPPPPYQVRNTTIAATTTQWTRFTTTYTFSSVRTFTSSTAPRRPPSSAATTSTSPQAVQMIEAAIEQIQDMYGTARDEFEIAAEETEKNTTYAADDRAAAREELDRLLEFYANLLEGDQAIALEVKGRVGQRIRELEQAVIALEERASHGD